MKLLQLSAWALALVISVVKGDASIQSLDKRLISSSSLHLNGPVALKTRDYEDRLLFAVEIDPKIEDPIQHFSGLEASSEWRYEQPLGTIANHYLFSIDRHAQESVVPIRDTLQRVIGKRSDDKKDSIHSLSKRATVIKRELTQNGVVSLQIIRSKQLVKRSIIPRQPAAPPPVAAPADSPVKAPPVDSSYVVLEEAQEKLQIADPLFPKQWHLINPVNLGHDINVTGVWYQGITGNGSRVAVIDDGLDFNHKDLADNYFAEGSYDFNNPGPDPLPRLSDDQHGTRCAGEIAAVRNDVCGLGIAYDSKVAGIRILSGRLSEADEALSLNYGMDVNDIYSCSWGPADDGRTMEAPSLLVKKAIINAVQNGRDGKGNVFVFASGNGGGFGDNCNFDGYTNSIYSITVGAIDRKGLHPFYSESCSANLVVTYSSGSGDHIHTTDIHNRCADNHGGTSAAAPIAAGIFALVLSARPELTWRDMQYLAVDTSVPVNLHEPGWQNTTIGRRFHHQYGYGKLDAYGLVERAKTWDLVNPQAWYFAEKVQANNAIPYTATGPGVVSSTVVKAEDLKSANFARIEHVTVLVNADLSHRGDISLTLVSPSGVRSEIAPARFMDQTSEGIDNWTFMSVAHWGETGEGEWQLEVANNHNAKGIGKLIDWTLQLWGESKDPSKAVVFPMPKLNDEEDIPSTSVVSTSTTSIDSTTTFSSTANEASSTVISSISGTLTTSVSTSETASASSSSGLPAGPTDIPEPAPEDEDSDKEDKGYLSFVPTFGLTGNTLLWVYGSFLLILGFTVCIAVFLCMQRRKKRLLHSGKDEHNSYEFDLIRSEEGLDQDAEELSYVDDLSDILTDEDDEHQPQPLVATPHDSTSRLSAGKKARDLYDPHTIKASEKTEVKPELNLSEPEELFKLGSDDEEEVHDAKSPLL